MEFHHSWKNRTFDLTKEKVPLFEDYSNSTNSICAATIYLFRFVSCSICFFCSKWVESIESNFLIALGQPQERCLNFPQGQLIYIQKRVWALMLFPPRGVPWFAVLSFSPEAPIRLFVRDKMIFKIMQTVLENVYTFIRNVWTVFKFWFQKSTLVIVHFPRNRRFIAHKQWQAKSNKQPKKLCSASEFRETVQPNKRTTLWFGATGKHINHIVWHSLKQPVLWWFQRLEHTQALKRFIIQVTVKSKQKQSSHLVELWRSVG